MENQGSKNKSGMATSRPLEKENQIGNDPNKMGRKKISDDSSKGIGLKRIKDKVQKQRGDSKNSQKMTPFGKMNPQSNQ